MEHTNKYGEYLEKGDYHRSPDKKWVYYPVYVEKMGFVNKFLGDFPKESKVLDVGCGEGITVENFRHLGYDITGIDLNYESQFVQKRDLLNTGFTAKSFDLILCLDVIEHLTFEEQEKSIREINRILKPGGLLLISIPNLAHLASRIKFLFVGKLIRTSTIERHRGDRPIGEYLHLLKENKFKVLKRKGVFPTFPLSSLLTYKFPDRVLWLHKILNRTLAYPNWCFLNIALAQKTDDI